MTQAAMQALEGAFTAPAPLVVNREGGSPVIVVCEHASCFIPPELNSLGLDAEHLKSHIVWDPGAFAVAEGLSNRLDAVLVASQISRLVYDCNRPPDAQGAVPAKSEIFDIPGNQGLDAAERASRIALVYEPFRANLASVIAAANSPTIIVTVHSFTPVYNGKARDVELGILHDTDSRLADAMLMNTHWHTALDVRRNEPYGPEDGVTHTLRENAVSAGLHNVMIEIRNDLITTPREQDAMAATLSGWIISGLRELGVAIPGEEH
ncbi:MAG: N-formylglutamate amidohydrolase [Anderseniella sp.]